MMLTRVDLLKDLADQRSHAESRVRAVADNLAFEENVASERCREFEDATTGMPLQAALARYYREMVEGISRSHVPSTFRPENATAFMSAAIEPNQVIARLVRLDDALDAVSMNYADLATAVNGATRDDAIIAPIMRWFDRYPNARPTFAAFEAELAEDLAAADWAIRLVTRLGLEHHLPPEGERWHYGLMRYTVAEVLRAAGHITQPFAVPTILESCGHVWFFPPPRRSGAGYVVDLDPTLARGLTRELLHARIDFRPHHLIRVGGIDGIAARPDLRSLRNGHLGLVRSVTGRMDYAEMMSP